MIAYDEKYLERLVDLQATSLVPRKEEQIVFPMPMSDSQDKG